MKGLDSALNFAGCAAIAALSLNGCLILYRLYRRKHIKDICQECGKSNAEFCNVLFFPDKQIPCFKYVLTPQGCSRKSCLHSHNEKSSFIQLIRYILQAKKSIDLCMFSLTCHELATAVLIKYRLGARVRVISDTEYMNMSGSKIQTFMEEGIAVRHDRSSYLMHHKFVIIDEKIVITGSFNWTHAAVIGNYENVVATNNQKIVQPYIGEFDRLWELFDAEHDEQGKTVIRNNLLGKGDMYYHK
uniref:mitochondrial cardiolipin hydrolase-like n=1 Tax=Styela clava TaxID=7725 RepID=UPI001939C916|nr:mitochondrial cardiolipin hydrolase-like [Styela clava]